MEGTVKTIKWFIEEYRQEDETGRYYLRNILSIWYSGLRIGLGLGVVPLIVYWILR